MPTEDDIEYLNRELGYFDLLFENLVEEVDVWHEVWIQLSALTGFVIFGLEQAFDAFHCLALVSSDFFNIEGAIETLNRLIALKTTITLSINGF